jgi:hypothetical protein
MGRHRRSVDGTDRRVQPSTGGQASHGPMEGAFFTAAPVGSHHARAVPRPCRACLARLALTDVLQDEEAIKKRLRCLYRKDVQSHSSSRKGARTRIWLGARPTEAPLSVVRTGEERFRGGERASGAVHTDTDAGRHPDRREAVVQQRAGRSICAGRGVLPADLVSAQTLPHVSFFQPFVY